MTPLPLRGYLADSPEVFGWPRRAAGGRAPEEVPRLATGLASAGTWGP